MSIEKDPSTLKDTLRLANSLLAELRSLSVITPVLKAKMKREQTASKNSTPHLSDKERQQQHVEAYNQVYYKHEKAHADNLALFHIGSFMAYHMEPRNLQATLFKQSYKELDSYTDAQLAPFYSLLASQGKPFFRRCALVAKPEKPFFLNRAEIIPDLAKKLLGHSFMCDNAGSIKGYMDCLKELEQHNSDLDIKELIKTLQLPATLVRKSVHSKYNTYIDFHNTPYELKIYGKKVATTLYDAMVWSQMEKGVQSLIKFPDTPNYYTGFSYGFDNQPASNLTEFLYTFYKHPFTLKHLDEFLLKKMVKAGANQEKWKKCRSTLLAYKLQDEIGQNKTVNSKKNKL